MFLNSFKKFLTLFITPNWKATMVSDKIVDTLSFRSNIPRHHTSFIPYAPTLTPSLTEQCCAFISCSFMGERVLCQCVIVLKLDLKCDLKI